MVRDRESAFELNGMEWNELNDGFLELSEMITDRGASSWSGICEIKYDISI